MIAIARIVLAQRILLAMVRITRVQEPFLVLHVDAAGVRTAAVVGLTVGPVGDGDRPAGRPPLERAAAGQIGAAEPEVGVGQICGGGRV